jgi:hypothetical protein
MRTHYKPKNKNVNKLKTYLDKQKTNKDERNKRHSTGRNS